MPSLYHTTWLQLYLHFAGFHVQLTEFPVQLSSNYDKVATSSASAMLHAM